jgi:alanine dehydrogenase
MTLLITEDDVAKCVTPMDVIEAEEEGFRQLGLGLAETLPRREIRIRDKELPHADPRQTKVAQGIAFLEESHVLILQMMYNFPGVRERPKRSLRYLIDTDDGDTLAVIDSIGLGASRTGAGGAVGAKFLSRRDSRTVGMVGAGRQARVQLRFLTYVRKDISRAYVFSRSATHAETFCVEASKELGIDVSKVDEVERMKELVDIMVTTTPSFSPIVSAEALDPGVHVNIIGADDPPKIELDAAALKKADKVVIAAEDSLSAGQFAIPISRGQFSKNQIYGTIGEIIAGKKPGRTRDEEITIFHNPGLTLEDVASGYMAFLRAKQEGLGKEIPDPFA